VAGGVSLSLKNVRGKTRRGLEPQPVSHHLPKCLPKRIRCGGVKKTKRGGLSTAVPGVLGRGGSFHVSRAGKIKKGGQLVHPPSGTNGPNTRRGGRGKMTKREEG